MSRFPALPGKRPGEDDPVAIVRTQKQFPAPEERFHLRNGEQ